MQTLGLIGGTSWVSTLDYYRLLNEETNRRLGGHNSARIIMYSLNFQEVLDFANRQDEKGLKKMLLDIARSLVDGGAMGIVLCANTFHQYAEFIGEQISVPIIHIAEATALEIRKAGLNRVALLGTRITMEKDFYKNILSEHKIETLIPDKAERNFIHGAIYNELSIAIFKEETKKRLIGIMNNMIQRGAQGIILGCTELPLILSQKDCSVPIFDTLRIHVMAAVEFALNEEMRK
jgi:aspartate racemase